MTEKQRLILKIMHLAYLVHEHTQYCVWIDFSGHVDSLSIRIAKSKERWQNQIFRNEFYQEHVKCKDGKYLYLNSVIQVLEQIIEDGELPYDELDYEREYHDTYFVPDF